MARSTTELSSEIHFEHRVRAALELRILLSEPRPVEDHAEVARRILGKTGVDLSSLARRDPMADQGVDVQLAPANQVENHPAIGEGCPGVSKVWRFHVGGDVSTDDRQPFQVDVTIGIELIDQTARAPQQDDTTTTRREFDRRIHCEVAAGRLEDNVEATRCKTLERGLSAWLVRVERGVGAVLGRQLTPRRQEVKRHHRPAPGETSELAGQLANQASADNGDAFAKLN